MGPVELASRQFDWSDSARWQDYENQFEEQRREKIVGNTMRVIDSSLHQLHTAASLL